MIKKEINGIICFEFELLQPYSHLHHAVFSRTAGNLSFKTGKAVTVEPQITLTYANQVHGSDTYLVQKNSPSYIHSCDALITNCNKRALCINHADCQAALFYDPFKECIAAVHCGWRSSVENIYKNTIRDLHDHFGSRPEDLLVCVSPSLGPNHAEFTHFERELPRSFWRFQTKPTYFDFWKITEQQLLDEGIQPQHIEIAKMCTFEQKELFYSYRRDHTIDRNLTLIYKK